MVPDGRFGTSSERPERANLGADIDAPSIEWLNAELSPPLRVVRSQPDPPLDLERSSFDLIWALSVFTHLTDNSLAWLRELHALLKPGGLLDRQLHGPVDQPLGAERALGRGLGRAERSPSRPGLGSRRPARAHVRSGGFESTGAVPLRSPMCSPR